ncbi:MAG: glutamine amidotransferase [Phycisphaerae bacterium]
MNPFDAKLVFDVPDWPRVLSAAAGVLLAFELAMMLLHIWRGPYRKDPLSALGVTGAALLTAPLAAMGAYLGGPANRQAMAIMALLAGPIVTAVAAAYGLITSTIDQPFRGKALVVESLRGTAIIALATAVCFWPCGGSLAAITLCMIAWVIRGYARTTSPIRPWLKTLFLALRIAAILLLAIHLTRPALEFRSKKPIPSVVLVGIDLSSSMQRRDMPRDYTLTTMPDSGDPARRIESVRQALKHQEDAIKSLTEEGDVDVYGFPESKGGMVKRLAFLPAAGNSAGQPPPPPLDVPGADGTRTPIGDSLAEVFSQYAASSKEVSAILVISDGCNNASDILPPEKEAELMGLRGVPVFTAGVGSETVTKSMRTLNVKDLTSPDEVEAFNRLPITAVVEALGLQDKAVRVTCRFGDAEVAREDFTPASRQATRTFSFSHVPLAAGFQRLTVSAEVLGGAPVGLEGQFSANKLVHVVDRELRVLYVEGKFRPEAKYVADALKAARRFSIDRRYIIQPLGPDKTPPLSENPDDWLKYHAIIFGDVAASHFTPKQLEIVKMLVADKGKGFCMLGGDKSFGRGGWGDTPIADVLPIDVKASKDNVDGRQKIVPTPEGLLNEIMRVGADEKDVAGPWAELDVPNGANRLVKPKPGAVVLAKTANGDPLVVCQPYGAGRSLAVAFDETWRWVLSPPPKGAEAPIKDTADYQRRFWRQVALYLAAPKGNVWISTDKTQYDFRKLTIPSRRADRAEMGVESIEVTAGVEDAFGNPVLDAPREVTLSPPARAGSTQPGAPVPLQLQRAGARTQQSGHLSDQPVLRAILPPPTIPGTYTLKITADVGGKKLTAENRYEIIDRDLEAVDILANFATLRQMADVSKGKFAPLSGLPKLLEDLHKTILAANALRVRQEVTHLDLGREPAIFWPLLVLLMGLFCAEWAIRKRKGLV